ncbi:MAG: TonB C-terminal domain-containing protein [Campylobacterota bacterium]|nr:TonB C-terminal domain-containing protein [Campylobacterota bacterium]
MVSPNDRYFYLSGALSFGLFFLFTALFGLILLKSDQVKSYALKKDDYIAVSINLPLTKPSRHDTKKPAPKPIVKPEPVQPPKAEVPQTAPDVSSLFSDIWTQKVSTKPKKDVAKVDSKRLSAIEKRIKTTKSEKSLEASEKIKKLDLKRPSVELVGSSSSSASEVNEYLARIQAFVYEHFYPPMNSEGNSAKIRLRLDSFGKMKDYRILAPSGSPAFNNEVDLLKKRLKSVTFPRHPKRESITIDIILTVEE